MGRSWKTFYPLGKWLVVKADPREKTTKGGIELPDTLSIAERLMEGTGRILKVGNREEIFKVTTTHLEPGMRICYRGYLKDITDVFDQEEEGRPIFMLMADDALMVIDEDVRMGVFS